MKIEKQSSKFIKPIVPTPSTLHHYKLGFLDEVAPDADCSICLFFYAYVFLEAKDVPYFKEALDVSAFAA